MMTDMSNPTPSAIEARAHALGQLRAALMGRTVPTQDDFAWLTDQIAPGNTVLSMSAWDSAHAGFRAGMAVPS